MLKLTYQFLGVLVAYTPEFVLRGITVVLGELMMLTHRRGIVYSNLHHAFPDRPRKWHRRIAHESNRRMFETVLLSMAAPFLSDKRLRKIARIAPTTENIFRSTGSDPARPIVLTACHLAYWESLSWLPLFTAPPEREVGVIFRPLDNSTTDQWVKRTRERFGVKLLSRKQNLPDAFRILNRHGVVALLYDQNAGQPGVLTTMFGRICSSTELPGTFVERTGAELKSVVPRRLAFWRIEIDCIPQKLEPDAVKITIALNRWLEETLANDDDLCASWLWSHDRWRNQDTPEKRLRLESKRNFLAAELEQRGLAALPRKTRIFVRLPNWLGDVVMAVPLLRALRASRPDAELTLIAKPSFLPLLESWGVADRCEPLPPRGLGYFVHFWKLRRRYPDVYLLFTNSLRGDIEAWLTRCSHRFGLVKRGHRRPLLTHRYAVPADFDERQHHQLELWENFLRAFGLNAPPDRTPLTQLTSYNLPLTTHHTVIGFIAGSENNPEKRWPLAHWCRLAETLLAENPSAVIELFGTANDRPITAAIAAGLDPARVHDLAGSTDLATYVEKLRACRLLVTNDTGGMHLANALGVPLVALFGPTNPVRTGPVFSTRFEILQPPGCAATGGGSLGDLLPETVLAAVRLQLTPSAA